MAADGQFMMPSADDSSPSSNHIGHALGQLHERPFDSIGLGYRHVLVRNKRKGECERFSETALGLVVVAAYANHCCASQLEFQVVTAKASSFPGAARRECPWKKEDYSAKPEAARQSKFGPVGSNGSKVRRFFSHLQHGG